ncbi:MAG: C40 family peptidase [Scytolyngbya sp. HA4215-MV1]|nr:C40 family peptidase [Scytolyngbya sp. HA4215-MV1]
MQYRLPHAINLYKSPALEGLVTQAHAGRYLRQLPAIADILQPPDESAIAVCLCEDDYPGWLSPADWNQRKIAATPYHPTVLSEAEIRQRVPEVIAFTQQAMALPNQYLWGGTVGPNYDCSGLMQTAFASVGIWLPRDAYQQEAFVQGIDLADLRPGDLVFFGPPQKATHVGLYLGETRYIHSSGKDQGRNGIGIDVLSEQGDRVSQTYYRQVRGAGRVIASYKPLHAE